VNILAAVTCTMLCLHTNIMRHDNQWRKKMF